MGNRKKKREDRLYQTLRNNRKKRFQDKAAAELRAREDRRIESMLNEVQVKES